MADLINPFLDFRMSQGWIAGSHKNNPAMDYATPVGFRFGSPAAGVYRRLPSNLSRTDPTAAGNMGELLIVGGRWDKYRIRFAHLDRHIAEAGQRVGQLVPLAATGNTGYVRPAPTPEHPEFGAHVHTYGLTPTGDRWNWTLYADAPSPSPAAGGAQPFNPFEEDEEMISQEAQDWFNSWFDQIRKLLIVPGQPYGYPAAVLNELRGVVEPALGSIAAGGIMFPGAGYLAFPALVNTIREGAGAQPAGVDEEALAKSLAPILASLIPQNVASLTDGQIEQIAEAVNDEQDRRERERLAG